MLRIINASYLPREIRAVHVQALSRDGDQPNFYMSRNIFETLKIIKFIK